MRHGHARFVGALRRARRPSTALTCLVLAAAGAAQAHITLETAQAPAGSYYKAVFRVGHGCDGSPVRQLVVEIPPGVRGAKPMVKPGWRIDIQRARLDTPYDSHGHTVTEDVSQVRFSGGPLPDAYYDEFALMAQLPEQPGPIYWKVAQLCEKGRVDWVEIPAAGQSLHDLKAPAALLDVVPNEHAGHVH